MITDILSSLFRFHSNRKERNSMWKKLVIVLCALFGTFSIAYGYYNYSLNAANKSYSVGGNVTGRINMAPSGIAGTHIGLQEGDHVLIGGNNPESGNPLSFQLLVFDQNYTDYDNTDTVNIMRTPISNWLTVSDELVSSNFNVDVGDPAVYDFYTGNVIDYCFSDYSKTEQYKQETTFNQWLKNNAELSLLAPRDLSGLRTTLKNNTSTDSWFSIVRTECKSVLQSAKDMYGFFPFNELIYGSNASLFTGNMNAFSIPYAQILSFRRSDVSRPNIFGYFNTAGVMEFLEQVRYTFVGNFRPFLFVDLSNVVFGLSTSSGNNLRAEVDDTFLVNTSLPYYTQGGMPMKLRMLDSNMTATLLNISDQQGQTLSQAVKGKTLYLNATANPGINYTISALIFDSNHHLIGYQPLNDTQAGNYTYEFDTTGLSVGNYEIAIVNEVFDQTSSDPTYSSLISDVKPLEIVEPVSIQATAKTGLENNKNTNQGDSIATYSTSHGVNPITVTVVSDTSVQGHDNDYQLFSVSGGNVIVNHPDGLDAGDYYFKLNAIDANGDPTGGLNSNIVHISVAKTNTTIAFNDPNQTKKSINNAGTSWSEIATATPTTGTKISYTKVPASPAKPQ